MATHLSEQLMKTTTSDDGDGPLCAGVELVAKQHHDATPTTAAQRSLRIGFVVYRIWDVNDADRTFRIDFRLHATWSVSCKSSDGTGDVVVPEWNFTNSVDDVHVVDTDAPRRVGGQPSAALPPALANASIPPGDATHWWTTNVRYRGTFFHCNDRVQRSYQCFPMDMHDFDVVVRVPRVHLQGIASVVRDPERSDCHTSLAVKDAGLIDFRVLDLTAHVHVNEPKAVNFKPDVVLSVVTARRAYYYFTCVYVPLAIIVGMSLTSFLMSDFADRMNLLITVLLCIVAFKFTVAARLPILPHATQLDRYITFLYAFVVALVLSHAISHRYFSCDDNTTAASCTTFDSVSGWVWAGVWFLAHGYVLGSVVLYELRVDRACKLVVWRYTEFRERGCTGAL